MVTGVRREDRNPNIRVGNFRTSRYDTRRLSPVIRSQETVRPVQSVGEGISKVNDATEKFNGNVLYRLYFKGLANEEIGEGKMTDVVAEFGVAICDLRGNLLLDCFGVKEPVDKNEMTQSIKDIFASNFRDAEEDDPQTLLYKNLWLETEAALCSATSMARHHRIKNEIGNLKFNDKEISADGATFMQEPSRTPQKSVPIMNIANAEKETTEWIIKHGRSCRNKVVTMSHDARESSRFNSDPVDAVVSLMSRSFTGGLEQTVHGNLRPDAATSGKIPDAIWHEFPASTTENKLNDVIDRFQILKQQETERKLKFQKLPDSDIDVIDRFTVSQPVLVAGNDVQFAYKLARESISHEDPRGAKAAWTEECVFCYNDTCADRMFSVNKCRHRFCFHCLKLQVEVKLHQGMVPKCPHDGCKSELVIDACGKILCPKLIEMWKHRIKENAIPVTKRIYCPYQMCSALMSKTDISESAKSLLSVYPKSGLRRCVECCGLFCVDCKVPWHGKLSCKDYKKLHSNLPAADMELKSLADQKMWRQCGKCQHMIELSHGCNHVTCRCGFEFCYNCGGKWNKKMGTCTKLCPPWNDLPDYDHELRYLVPVHASASREGQAGELAQSHFPPRLVMRQ